MNNSLATIVPAQLVGALLGCPLALCIVSYLDNHYRQSPSQTTPPMVSVYTNDSQPPSQPTPQTVSVYTNDCPVCSQDGENCAYQCPFCKKGDHSTYTHRDPSEYFLCPVCHCFHKASKELITQFKVLLKAKEQQAALFPQTPTPSENLH